MGARTSGTSTRRDVVNVHALYERLVALFLRYATPGCPRGLPRLPPVARVSRRVTRILGLNPSALTLQGTNTYLVGAGHERALIDCGEGRAGYAENVLRAMREEGCERLKCVLCTHWHPDHVGGLRALRRALGVDVPAYKRIRRDKGEYERVDGERGCARTYVDVRDGDVIAVEGATLRAVHTPGHTTDHTCFAFEEEGAVFAGDCVLNGSTTDFEDLTSYARSLKRIKEEFESYKRLGVSENGANRLYPSHGDVVADGAKKVDAYIKHRVSRENVLLNTLREHPTRGMTAWELTRSVYATLVSVIVLYTSCAKITRQHIEKMLDDGVIGERREKSAMATLTFGLLGGDVVRYYAIER
tara:strand:- start:2543 stop:3616 length:1074 start_codon:yes stop_codon:yes gene_type:complete